MDAVEWRVCEERLQDVDLAERVMRSFNGFRHPPGRIHVARTTGKGHKPEERRRVFAANAAEVVLPILRKEGTRSLAVGWGRTMRDLCCYGLGRLCALDAPRTGHPLNIFPVCGEPFRASADVSPSSISVALGRILNGDTRRVRSLAGVPAVIPGQLSEQDVDAVRRMLEAVPVFREIFGSTDKDDQPIRLGMADRMTTLLASFGPAKSDSP